MTGPRLLPFLPTIRTASAPEDGSSQAHAGSGVVMAEDSARTEDLGAIDGSKGPGSRDWGHDNTVTWNLMESHTLRLGIPKYMRAAILLRRNNHDIFTAKIHFKTDVSGFPFQRLQDGLLGSDDDSVIFNPSECPPNVLCLWTVDSDNLGAVDLVSQQSVEPKTPLTDMVHPDETVMESDMTDEIDSLLPPTRVEESISQSWFVNLWDTNCDLDKKDRLPPSLERKI